MDRDMVHGNQLMPQLCVEADIYEDNGMTTTIKTIMFPLILLATITGALMAGIAIIFIKFYNVLRAIPKVMGEMYNEAE